MSVMFYYCTICGARKEGQHFGSRCGTAYISGVCEGVHLLTEATPLRRLESMGLRAYIFEMHGGQLMISPIYVLGRKVYPVITPTSSSKGVDIELINPDRIAQFMIPAPMWYPKTNSDHGFTTMHLLDSDDKHKLELQKVREQAKREREQKNDGGC